MPARDPAHVVMLGTDPGTHGGISAVVAAWRAGGLFERWPIEYIVSHRVGTRGEKFVTAVEGFQAWLALAWRHGRGILHVHAASRWSFWRKAAYMAAALAAGWPVVFHLHGGRFIHFHQALGPFGRAAVRFFLDRAAVIVVLSERWAAWMHGITSNPRIVCLPNPVALPPPTSAVREPDLIAFAGRCEAAKGVYDLLEAVSRLRPVCPRLRVECAGDGDMARLRRRALELGVGPQVTMRGWIGERERETLLARATVFVLPSHVEALPMSLLEAMAAGCPVIATKVGGIPDLVRDGENGLLVPPGKPGALADALRRLLADPVLAGRLGQQARSTIAARYTVERSLERLEQIYAGLGVRRDAPRPVAVPRKLQEIS
jgi:glycosyltransferase involved in cell wall biosynthesis